MLELRRGGSMVQSPRAGHRLAACQGEEGGGGVLAASTTWTLTLTLTAAGLSRCRCPALCLSIPRNPVKWKG